MPLMSQLKILPLLTLTLAPKILAQVLALPA